MIEAPEFKNVLTHRKRDQRALCGVLFAPPFSKVAEEGVLKRFQYLHTRSGECIHFYCVGFGAYLAPPTYRDAKLVTELHDDKGGSIPWQFSEIAFGTFISEMHSKTSWRYSGETELLLFNPTVDYTDCLVLKVNRMITDGVIGTPGELFEKIINHSQKLHATTAGFSNEQMPKSIWKALIGVLKEGPVGALEGFTAGKHYATVNITKKTT